MLRKIGIFSFFNAATQITTACIGLVLSPFIVQGLGYSFYGVFNILTLILGVSVLFDFGFSKALVKFSAEFLVTGDKKVFSEIFWFSFWVQLFIGISVGLFLFCFAEEISTSVFKSYNYGTFNSIKWLAFGFPITLLISSVRGIFEGMMLFKQVNFIKFFLNSSIFIIPVICIFLGSQNLVIFVMFISITRLIVLIYSLLILFQRNPFLLNSFSFNFKNPSSYILSFTGWVAVSNLIVPLIGHLDKILISYVLGSSFVTFYILPFDIINGLYLLPNSLIIVLYPLFSQRSNDFLLLKKYSDSASKVFLLFLIPLSLIFTSFSYEFLKLWQGEIIADNSKMILGILVLTIPLTAISWIYSNILLAIGKSKILAFNLLFQGIVFTPMIFISVNVWGIWGVTIVIFLRLFIESTIYILIAYNKIGFSFVDKNLLIVFLSLVYLFFIVVFNHLFLFEFLSHKVIIVITEILGFLFLFYKFVIDQNDIKMINSNFKSL